MSTEHQKYSTENQLAAIRTYAERRGIPIVRIYADEGKSGLTISGRRELQNLIADVHDGRADYSIVLVYDVSRWGRFQDPDEAAALERDFKQAGISIRYCAEPFENDGSLSATIIKSMKRAMAGEYSRELSAKVFAGQCRLVSLGFRQGGAAGYGLRRHLVDEARRPKGELRIGDRKSIQTDRVILVPGPPDEMLTVQRMYRLFVEDMMSEQQISDLLNGEGVSTDLGRRWTRGTVRQVLTNEKYVGNNVFNRTSFKLKQVFVRNSPDQFIRAKGVFEPIVEQALFDAAQEIFIARSRRLSDDEMLSLVAKLLAETGWLSALLIDERDDMPASTAYRSRFGSLLRVYELVGYRPQRDYRYVEINRYLRSIHAEIVEETILGIEKCGGAIERDPVTDILTVNQEFRASLIIARCMTTNAGSLRWKLRLETALAPDITVGVRMAACNRQILDYYVLPRMTFCDTKLRMTEDNGFGLDAFRYDTIDAFVQIAARRSIRRAAA